MALQSYRYENINGAVVTTDNFMNGTGEAGFLVVYDTSTSGLGPAFDDIGAVVKLSVVQNGSGEKPAGILLNDVVNKDLTQTHLNQHKREVQLGGKVVLLQGGMVVTNALSGTQNPAPGDAAYFTIGGALSTTSTNSTRVGTFVSSRDTNGYVKVNLTII